MTRRTVGGRSCDSQSVSSSFSMLICSPHRMTVMDSLVEHTAMLEMMSAQDRL